jgi:hypothetical protein
MVREIWILDTQYSFCMFESSVFFTATREAESTAPCEDIMDNVMLSFGRSGMVFHGVFAWMAYVSISCIGGKLAIYING